MSYLSFIWETSGLLFKWYTLATIAYIYGMNVIKPFDLYQKIQQVKVL